MFDKKQQISGQPMYNTRIEKIWQTVQSFFSDLRFAIRNCAHKHGGLWAFLCLWPCVLAVCLCILSSLITSMNRFGCGMSEIFQIICAF